MKKKWNDRLIKWFFGIEGVVDERVKNEIGHVAVKTVIILFIFELLFNALVDWYALAGFVHDFENFFYIIMSIQFLAILLIMFLFITMALRRRGVINKEVTTADKSKAVKQIRNKWLRLSPILFLMYWILNSVFQFTGRIF